MFRNLAVTILSLIYFGCNALAGTEFEKAKQEDGRFYNIAKAPNFGLWDVISMRINSDWADWPDWRETKQLELVTDRVYTDQVKVTFINHASFLIQTQGLNILTDPIFSNRCSPVSFAGPSRVHAPGIAMNRLPKIDFIIISHDHYDHLDKDSIEFIAERDKPTIYVGKGLGDDIDDSASVVEMDWWDSHKFNDKVTVNFVEVQHFSGRGLFDRFSTLWGGYVLEIEDKKIFFGGDTGYAGHFKKVHKKFGPMDVSFIPIGAYEPRYFMKFYHMNPKESVKAHQDLESKLSIGMHFGTFQLTAEEIDDPKKQLEVHKKKNRIKKPDFITLDVGVAYTLEWIRDRFQVSTDLLSN